MSILSEMQKKELWATKDHSNFAHIELTAHNFIRVCRHKSILEYLYSQNFTEAYNALKSEVNIDYTPDPKSKYAQLLEKKWTSVIRLQKKVRILF